MKSISELEPHELLPVAVMRCLAIVEYLGRSRSKNSALTLQNAAIFDSALKNPRITRRLLSELAPDKLAGLDFSPVLYPGEEEHGGPVNKREITKVAALLSQAELIALESVEGAVVLRPKAPGSLLDANQIPARWHATLKALKGLSSKSVTTLQNAAIRESRNEAEQHVFITRALNSKRGDKEL